MSKRFTEQENSGSSEQQCEKSATVFKSSNNRRHLLPHKQIYGGDIPIVSVLTMNLPIWVFEPLGDVQAVTEELRYAKMFLDRMCDMQEPAERLCLLCGFIVSGYSAMTGRRRKPFNPLLGETYDYVSEDGWRYHAEQVSHHPPVTACHAEGPGWELFQALQAKFSFTLFSVSITSVLPVRLTLANGDEYCWSKVTTTVQNIRSEAQKRRVLNEGQMLIRSNTGVEARLVFHPDNNGTVTGEVYRLKDGTVLHRLTGSWERGLSRLAGEGRLERIFEPTPSPTHADNYYGFNDFTVTLNEIQPDELPYLPSTDSRLRPDQRYLENAEPELAVEAKKELEKAQRKRANAAHTVMWFGKKPDSFTGNFLWNSNKRYWPAKQDKFQDDHSQRMLSLFEKKL